MGKHYSLSQSIGSSLYFIRRGSWDECFIYMGLFIPIITTFTVYRMGSSQCRQCQITKEELDLASYSNFKSINEIEQKYKIYAETNMLGFYSIRMQRIIEKLYTLDQVDLCDAIIRLSCSKMQEKRDRMLDDIQSIDLQQLDHLSLLETLPKNVQIKYNEESSIFYDNEDIELDKTHPSLHKKVETSNQNSTLKILNKHALKLASTKKGQPLSEKNNFIVIGTVGCFDSKDVLKPLSLPTQKTALRIFLQKIEATNIKYNRNVIAIFIINPECQNDFDKEIALFQGELLLPIIKFQKIIYKPIYPCVDFQRKIVVTPQEDIMYHYQGGDLIGFIIKNPRLEILLHKFEFVQIANISNLLQRIGDIQSLSYLQQNAETDIIAYVAGSEKGSETLKLHKNFIEKVCLSPKQANKVCYQLAHTYYIRSVILVSKGLHFQKMISMRMKSETVSKPTIVSFSRTFENVLYSPITVLVSSYNQFTHSQNQQVEYSNYCKAVVGITDTKQDQIVQICPQILFGPRSQLQLIISKLTSLPSVGFPLLLNGQKVDLKNGKADEKAEK